MLKIRASNTSWGSCFSLRSSLWGRGQTEKPSEGHLRGSCCNIFLHICYPSFEPHCPTPLPSQTGENLASHLHLPHLPSLLSPLLNPFCFPSPSLPPRKPGSDRPGCEWLATAQITFSAWAVDCYTGSTDSAHRRDVCCCCCYFLFCLMEVNKTQTISENYTYGSGWEELFLSLSLWLPPSFPW